MDNTPQKTFWLDAAQSVTSKGLTAKKAARLGDLHARRQETQGQFFTPDFICIGIWAALSQVVNESKRALTAIDTSVGTGRLLNPAPLDRVDVYGIEIDERCIDALASAASEAEANYDFRVGGLQDADIDHFDIAVINPPYSLTLESPHLHPYDCTAFGRFGPNTSTLSHEYALAQALDGADYVAAVLPAGMESICRDSARLHTIVKLPANAFRAEGANVRTIVAFFDRRELKGLPQTLSLAERDIWPALSLSPARENYRAPRLRIGGIDEGEPTITRPVTGDTTVTLHHHRRKIILHFNCGLTEAKVLNGILEEDVAPIFKHRYPVGLPYTGSGRLLLDSYLMQDDPHAVFEAFVESIRHHGGTPIVSPTLHGYFRKLVKKHRLAVAPFRKVVKAREACTVKLVATRSCMLIPGDPKSPPIRRGTELSAVDKGSELEVTHQGCTVVLRRDQAQKRFSISDDAPSKTDWMVIHEGMHASHPANFESACGRIDAAGIDWLWPYQRYSFAELLTKPYGSIAAWMQGTGKARLALALGWISGKGLICVESGLVPEMLREVVKLGIGEHVKVLRTPDDCAELARINIVSYHAIRSRHGKRTLASYLRRRINTLVSDEGSLLRNDDTQQSRAVAQVAPRRLYILDGTPIANYPRDLLKLAAVSTGHGVAHQCYGIGNRHHMTENLLHTASATLRGIDAFTEKHVVLEWVTNQFKEDFRGAKREIPRINNLWEFREWTAPFVQRRVRMEPDVAPYAGCPEPTFANITVDWDDEHFGHYLKTCIEFAEYYRNHKAEQEKHGKGINLTLVLARIQTVLRASNCPHAPGKNAIGSYIAPTSKQRAVVDRAIEHVQAGRKTMIYAGTPAAVERLCQLLGQHGIKAVAFHGETPIAQRTKALDEDFRFGDAQVLVSSWVGQRGLNIPQAKAILFYERDWGGDTEPQAVARTQRPDQDASVFVERFHLAGGIDEYMAQMQDWKQSAADAGLDWGDGATEDDVFHHLDTILGNFVQDVFNLSTHETAKLLGVA
jgi:hypothetical protein